MSSRLWANKLMDNPPPKPKTKKDKFLTYLSAGIDATIIILLIVTITLNSCNICFQSSIGGIQYRRCKNVSDIMEEGLPQEIIDIYNQTDVYLIESREDVDVGWYETNE